MTPRDLPILSLLLLLGTGLAACGNTTDGGSPDGGADAGDAGDGGLVDSGPDDGGTTDGGGDGGDDGGASDAGGPDGGGDDGGISDGGDPGPSPPALPTFSGASCPTLLSGIGRSESVNTGFPSSGDSRDFRLVVPSTYDPANPAGLVIAWHWLGASSGSFYNDGEIASAAERTGMIFALLDRLENSSGQKAYQFDWPFVETWGADKEVVFHEDVIACVSEQFGVDPRKIHAMGVSAGGLWLTYLSTLPAIDRFATVLPVSGGLGADPLGVWSMQFAPQANKFPAVVIWGGILDNLLAVDFHAASQAYRDALLADGHFVVACMHDQGHAIPPMEPPAGESMFFVLWRFMQDHPYGGLPGASPYQSTGLSADWPSWCQIASP